MGYHLDPRMPKPEAVRPALHAGALGGQAAGQGLRRLSRRHGVDLCRDAAHRHPHRQCAAGARRQAGRARAGMDAQQRRLPAHLVRAELSRRRLRAAQPRLPRRTAAARARALRGAAGHRACRSASAAGRDRAQGICARSWCSAASRKPIADMVVHPADVLESERRHAAGAGARHRAVGPAVDHLHVGHDRPVQGRAVVLHPSLQHGGVGAVPRRRRPLHDQPADVPFGRRHAGHRDADPWRLDLDGRRLRHRVLLADRQEDRHHHHHPARRDGRVPAEAPAERRTTRTIR